jgi:hypothetical protein
VDPGIIGAIFAAISAVVGIVLTAYYTLRSYRLQKQTDREIALRDSRMKAYERYLKAFRGDISLYDFGHTPAKDSPVKIKAVNEYWLAYSNLFQIAPDSVLLSVTDFHKLGWMEDTKLRDEAFYQEFKRLYAKMIIEMRKDTFKKTEFETTELKQDVVEKRLPFAFPSKPTEEDREALGVGILRNPIPEDPQG